MQFWLVGATKVLLLAQTQQAALVGVVRDGDTGEPLAGAVVALTDLGRVALSDDRGRYELRGVATGPQHLTVRRIGYAPRTLDALVPTQGRLEINVALRATAFLLGRVEVRPDVAVRGAEGGDSSAFPDRSVSATAVRNHPLLAEPDVFLALGGGEIVMRAESPSGMHVRGGASDQTAYALDGVPVFNPYHAAGAFSAWNPDVLERVRVSSSLPSAGLPDALSAVVSGVTRTPGSDVRVQGSVTTTHARIAADGPLGVGDAGYLVSVRSGFPGVVAPPRREPAYLKGEGGDLLATVHAAALGGRVRLLGYDSENEVDAAAVAHGADAISPAPGRNAFAWRSRSLGAEWRGRVRGSAVRVLGWHAFGDAGALWDAGGTAPVEMDAVRRDDGMLGMVERRASRSATTAGVRVHRSRTSYTVGPAGPTAGGGMDSSAVSARIPAGTAFVGHERALGERLAANVGFSATATLGRVYPSPQAQLQWRASRRLRVSGAYARSYQFAQSMRNPESVVSVAFPVDLYVGAGAGGVPVARSERAIIAGEYRLLESARLGAQAYLREFHGVLLVAPRTGEPFANPSEVAAGSGTARGFSIDAAVSGARYGVVASYGWQRVRLDGAGSSYVPEYAPSHVMETGVILFPSPTSSIRLGATGALGRRATAVTGAFEWEACNLIDGCEFAGSPRHAHDRLGATRLSSYLRVDAGFRKHWHVGLAGHDAVIGLFGTVTNVLGRTNVLTTAIDPVTGEPAEVEMRSRVPLVVGLDWRF